MAENQEGNATYIAAANPTAVIGLLDEIDRLTAERDAALTYAKRYKHLRDDCFRVSVNGIMFVSVPNKWPSEHQTTTAEDDAAIDAAMGEKL